jgi:hypothetical protein
MSDHEPIARTTIAIPASMHADLAREARLRGRSVSAIVRGLVEAHLSTARVVAPSTASKEPVR